MDFHGQTIAHAYCNTPVTRVRLFQCSLSEIRWGNVIVLLCGHGHCNAADDNMNGKGNEAAFLCSPKASYFTLNYCQCVHFVKSNRTRRLLAAHHDVNEIVFASLQRLRCEPLTALTVN